MLKFLLCLGYGAIEIVAVAWLTERAHNGLALGWSLAYLVAINLVAFGFYVYDKLFAILLSVLPFRVPELLLVWGLAVPGGWIGALGAMAMANHKTSDDADATAFRLKLVGAYGLVMTLAAVILFVFTERPLVSLEQVDSVVERFVNLGMGAFRAALEGVKSL